MADVSVPAVVSEEKVLVLDPDGDVELLPGIGLPDSPVVVPPLTPAFAVGLDEPSVFDIPVRIRVSSKTLAASSPVFAALLTGRMAEAEALRRAAAATAVKETEPAVPSIFGNVAAVARPPSRSLPSPPPSQRNRSRMAATSLPTGTLKRGQLPDSQSANGADDGSKRARLGDGFSAAKASPTQSPSAGLTSSSPVAISLPEDDATGLVSC